MTGRLLLGLHTALLTLALFGVAFPLLPILRLFSRRLRAGLPDLLGQASSELKSFNSPDGPLIWLHGVSVGEVNAMRPLLAGLRARGYRKFYVTSTCPEGVARARELSEGGDIYPAYAPLDLPRCVGRILDELRPALILAFEVDVWPNFALAAARRGIPLHLLNARVSPKTFRFFRLLSPLSRLVFGSLAGACAQTENDAASLAALGVNPDRLAVTGNLKFDIGAPAEVSPGVLERFLQTARRSDRLVTLVGGSTHPGEERMLLECALLLVARGVTAADDMQVVLAPRSIGRADELLRLGRDLGFDASAFTNRTARGLASPRLLVVDRFGVLPELYRLASAAYIGGSQGGAGGHSLIEAAAAGAPLLFGPDMRNFRLLAEALVADDCAATVRSAAECADRIAALLADPARREGISRRLVAFHQANRGAAERTFAALAPALAAAPPRRRPGANAKDQ